MSKNTPHAFFAQSAIPGNIFPVIPNQDGARKLAAQLQLEYTQWLGPEKLLENQFEQLDLVLKHAWQESPYYKKSMDNAGFNPHSEKINQALFKKLPILTRQEVQDAGDTIAAKQIPAAHGDRYNIQTSGSTGRAVQFQGTQVVRFFWQMFTLRDHIWQKRELGGKLAAIRWTHENEGLYPGVSRKTWGNAAENAFQTGPAYLLHIKTDTDKQVKWLLNIQPHYLITFPSQLSVLADYFQYSESGLNNLKGLMVVGETVTDELREKCQALWGLKINDCYTCEEVGYIALQCPEHNHYHIQSENVIVEILNENDKQCQPGETGRVVITSLNNFATPLIRYELGDYAEVGEPCPCGRGLPVLKKIKGRSRNRLALPGGGHTFPYFGDQEEYSAITTAIRQYQIIQESLQDIEVKLVVAETISNEQENDLKQLLNKHLGFDFNIRITYLEQIPKGPTGKYEEFISRII